jgi:hypothetical protein
MNDPGDSVLSRLATHLPGFQWMAGMLVHSNNIGDGFHRSDRIRYVRDGEELYPGAVVGLCFGDVEGRWLIQTEDGVWGWEDDEGFRSEIGDAPRPDLADMPTGGALLRQLGWGFGVSCTANGRWLLVGPSESGHPIVLAAEATLPRACIEAAKRLQRWPWVGTVESPASLPTTEEG